MIRVPQKLTPQALASSTGLPIVVVWSDDREPRVAADLSPDDARWLGRQLLQQADTAERIAAALVAAGFGPPRYPQEEP